MPFWQILVLVSILCVAVTSLLQRLIMRRDQVDPIAFSIVFQLFAGMFVLVVAFSCGFRLPELAGLWPYLVAMTLLYAGANLAWFRAIKTTEISKASVLLNMRIIWFAVGGVLLLKEHFGLLQTLGVFIILGAIILVTVEGGFKFSFKSGEKYAILAALFYGLAFVNDGFLIRHFEVFTYTSISLLLPPIFTLIVYPSSLRTIPKLIGKANLLPTMLCAFLFAGATLAVYAAYQAGGNISQIGPIVQTATVFTVIGAAIFLHERKNIWHKVLAAIICVIGIALIK